MKTTFNDRLGSRDTQHRNLLLASVNGEQVLFDFPGKSLPGVVLVLKQEYEKNGKWSFTSWDVDLADGVTPIVWTQDWGTGRYLAPTWQAALDRLNGTSGTVGMDAFKRYVRANFRTDNGVAAIRVMDEADGMLSQPSAPILADLLAAQQELADAQEEVAVVQVDVTAMAEAESARAAAADLRDRAAKARDAMKKGASLADLKALIGQPA